MKEERKFGEAFFLDYTFRATYLCNIIKRETNPVMRRKQILFVMMKAISNTRKSIDRAASARHKEGFVFPPSVQTDLFSYLKKEQQEYIKPVLRQLKKPAQEQLCSSLVDYLESGQVPFDLEIVTTSMFIHLTRWGLDDDGEDVRIIRPLKTANH